MLRLVRRSCRAVEEMKRSTGTKRSNKKTVATLYDWRSHMLMTQKACLVDGKNDPLL